MAPHVCTYRFGPSMGNMANFLGETDCCVHMSIAAGSPYTEFIHFEVKFARCDQLRAAAGGAKSLWAATCHDNAYAF